jgi:hypothetical protein
MLDPGAIRGQLQRTLKVRQVKTHGLWQFFQPNYIAAIGFAATEDECAQCKGNYFDLGNVVSHLSLYRLVRQCRLPYKPETTHGCLGALQKSTCS